MEIYLISILIFRNFIAQSNRQLLIVLLVATQYLLPQLHRAQKAAKIMAAKNISIQLPQAIFVVAVYLNAMRALW
jgi:hypothetical protein